MNSSFEPKINNRLLFEDRSFDFDPAKIIGEFVTSPHKEMANFGVFISHAIQNEILKRREFKPLSLIPNFSESACEALKEFTDFELKEIEKEESLTFKSFHDIIGEERERVAQVILIWCAKTQLLFLQLKLLIVIVYAITSVSIFSQQFGGNRNLPVA